MPGPLIEFRFPRALLGGDPQLRAQFVSRLTAAARDRHPDASKITARPCATSRALSVRVTLPGLNRLALMHELTLVLAADRIALRLTTH